MDFLISSLAYNLYHVFQQTILEEKDQTIRMNTYRLKYHDSGSLKITNLDRLIFTKNGELTI